MGHMRRFITFAILVGVTAGNALAAPAVGVSKSATNSVTKAGVQSTQPAGGQCAQPAGVVIPDHGNWSAFVQVKGKNFAFATGVRASWYVNDDDSKTPLVAQAVTLRGHNGTDEITIQIPNDPAKSGWAGDFANGVLRIYLIMPGQKQPLFAARYVLGNPPFSRRVARLPGATACGEVGGGIVNQKEPGPAATIVDKVILPTEAYFLFVFAPELPPSKVELWRTEAAADAWTIVSDNWGRDSSTRWGIEDTRVDFSKSYRYRLTLTYSDGRVGMTEIPPITPPAPKNPSWVTAGIKAVYVHTSNGGWKTNYDFQISWESLPYVRDYVISSNVPGVSKRFHVGFPSSGSVTVTIPTPAPGTYTFSVGASYLSDLYPGGWYQTPQSEWPTTTATVQ